MSQDPQSARVPPVGILWQGYTQTVRRVRSRNPNYKAIRNSRNKLGLFMVIGDVWDVDGSEQSTQKVGVPDSDVEHLGNKTLKVDCRLTFRPSHNESIPP